MIWEEEYHGEHKVVLDLFTHPQTRLFCSVTKGISKRFTNETHKIRGQHKMRNADKSSFQVALL
jgi:hypothetical protein